MSAGPRPVLFIGCGRMGTAFARALVPCRMVMALDAYAELPPGVQRLGTLKDAGRYGQLTVILAVKPQVFASLAGDLSELARQGHIFLSIMAGVAISRLAEVLGGQAEIIRAMPNTPAALGVGMSAAVASGNASDAARAEARSVLEAAGKCAWLEEESGLDAVTALSGSGPAYFYRFAEALMRAGMEEGLTEQLSALMVRQTFIGAARLAESECRKFHELRDDVTSPGGTTEAGLEEMEGPAGIDAIARRTVRSAARRSRELAAKS